MIQHITDLWARNLKGNHAFGARLLVTSLYGFLIIKILFLIPVVTDIVTYYRYHSASLLKKIIVAPGIIATYFPILFLSGTACIVFLFMLVKRTYVRNALVFWLSLSITQLCEPVANGSDYVLNLMLLLSIPLAENAPLQRFNIYQPMFFNTAVFMVQVHVGLIYFLSGYDKLMTSSWRTGEAISFVTSLDYYTNSFMASSLSSPMSQLLVAWFVIVFELLFPVLVWFNRFRIPLLIAGVIFHLCIIYFLNLPDFGLLMILCYAIFLRQKS
jgi:hypothetical protein